MNLWYIYWIVCAIPSKDSHLKEVLRMSDTSSRGNIRLPGDFFFKEVHSNHKVAQTPPPPAPLGPLAAFAGDFVGNGFNTIFRPNNSVTPTQLPNPLPPGDNILELNLTSEELAFS